MAAIASDIPTTPRHEHEPIEMRYVFTPDRLERVGDFCWRIGRESRRTMMVRIPDGRSEQGMVSFWPIRNGPIGGWTWNGHTQLPTLAPTLHAHGVWRGCVESGFLVEV